MCFRQFVTRCEYGMPTRDIVGRVMLFRYSISDIPCPVFPAGAKGNAFGWRKRFREEHSYLYKILNVQNINK